MTKESFRDFLKKRKYYDSPLGDFAKDALSDSDWKDDSLESFEEVFSKNTRACYEAREAFEKLKRTYTN
ncbi:hypothetical protein IQ230_09750 [Gloeocapsopsis crepidinum LEGE 06123]|uniref:Nif11 domain-containing protein n=1 Tax=Gloeocapsopsis crepidinum LEGE 06123 TaxID=588587 RepID=A0ABR9URG0_9CHRO|nr:hypothetical protein [Gloeocapsopsis crepidinum]MBE9190640.1 hypothetical protein [Gloeocapsopsis crepidinum LEGE 06123]